LHCEKPGEEASHTLTHLKFADKLNAMSTQFQFSSLTLYELGLLRYLYICFVDETMQIFNSHVLFLPQHYQTIAL